MNKVETGEAWQVRESQRQELIEGFVRASYQRETEVGDKTFHLGLASVIVKYLKDRQKGIARPEVRLDHCGIFFGAALIAFKNFARTEVEKDVLIVQFLEKVLVTGLNPFRTALTSQEIHEPEKIFHAPSAMSEIPLE